jgi:hypothetical protein
MIYTKSENSYENSPILIGGMHRSGTSLITSILRSCGLFIGKDIELMESNQYDNPKGYWEFLEIVGFTEELLKDFGGSWKDPSPFFDRNLFKHMEPQSIQAKNILEPLIQSHRVWGWKDPRVTITVPFWKNIFPNLKLIVCLRNPLEVAFSLSKRIISHVNFQKGLILWKDYYQILSNDLNLLSDRQIFVIHYESILKNPDEEIERLCKFTGLSPSKNDLDNAKGLIKPNLYRGFLPNDLLYKFEDLPSKTTELYDYFIEKSKYTIKEKNRNEKINEEYEISLKKLITTSTDFFDYVSNIIIEQREKIAQLKFQLNVEENKVKFYSQSKSWKITKPLRKIMQFFRPNNSKIINRDSGKK